MLVKFNLKTTCNEKSFECKYYHQLTNQVCDRLYYNVILISSHFIYFLVKILKLETIEYF